MQYTNTCHFISRAAADRYFRQYGYADAAGQLAEGAIILGPPSLLPGQTISIIHDEGRYCICSPDPVMAAPPASLQAEIALLSLEDNRIVLPKTRLKQYTQIKHLIETSGGQYNARGYFAFDAGVDVAQVFDSLLAGKALNAKKTTQSFFTPEDLAHRIVGAVGSVEGKVVMEPSAGHGALADVAEAAGAKLILVENYRPNVLALQAKGYDVIEQDFLTVTPEQTGLVDVVVMNPPFSNGQDCAHVLAAYRFLKPGGVLSAITSVSWMHGKQKKQQAFLRFLQNLNAQIDDIDAGAFAESGTGVPTLHIVLSKPLDSEPVASKLVASESVKGAQFGFSF
ncbi:hypothetical protein [Noviherbaspirillum galbum]|uniref:SAM-dependent methyltransferase n=1 Tax=Noviherbaspirillum galbum TaxID=2709383 RepID=A0A6B3SLA8_9BURK|nr:hypothetical protein [Noviherbaspirillum galbum]NEX60155.1 hypothetical protein [Noviherbaspirillum galbum]